MILPGYRVESLQNIALRKLRGSPSRSDKNGRGVAGADAGRYLRKLVFELLSLHKPELEHRLEVENLLVLYVGIRKDYYPLHPGHSPGGIDNGVESLPLLDEDEFGPRLVRCGYNRLRSSVKLKRNYHPACEHNGYLGRYRF